MNLLLTAQILASHQKSKFGIFPTENGELRLTIEILGNQKIYDEITSDENSEWSWTLYPPYFYLRDYPISPNDRSKVIAFKLIDEDVDDYDVALYLTEHNNVENISGKLIDTCEINISGIVDLSGKSCEFKIKWSKPEKNCLSACGSAA